MTTKQEVLERVGQKHVEIRAHLAYIAGVFHSNGSPEALRGAGDRLFGAANEMEDYLNDFANLHKEEQDNLLKQGYEEQDGEADGCVSGCCDAGPTKGEINMLEDGLASLKESVSALKAGDLVTAREALEWCDSVTDGLSKKKKKEENCCGC